LEEIEFTILRPKLKKLTHLIRNPSNNTSC
jgi:hypothetical protein